MTIHLILQPSEQHPLRSRGQRQSCENVGAAHEIARVEPRAVLDQPNIAREIGRGKLFKGLAALVRDYKVDQVATPDWLWIADQI